MIAGDDWFMPFIVILICAVGISTGVGIHIGKGICGGDTDSKCERGRVYVKQKDYWVRTSRGCKHD